MIPSLPWSDLSPQGLLFVRNGTVLLISRSLKIENILLSVPSATQAAILDWIRRVEVKLGMKVMDLAVWPDVASVGLCPSGYDLIQHLNAALPPEAAMQEYQVTLSVDGLYLSGHEAWMYTFPRTHHEAGQDLIKTIATWLPGLISFTVQFVLGGSAHAQITRMRQASAVLDISPSA